MGSRRRTVARGRWCVYMSTSSGENVLWWDREVDSTGKRIRMDVRCAAREIWEDACKQTRILIGEACAAALLMERSVAQISRYLDRRGIPVSGQDVKRLLTCAFARRLRRYAAKLRRIRLVGDMSQIAASEPVHNVTIPGAPGALSRYSSLIQEAQASITWITGQYDQPRCQVRHGILAVAVTVAVRF